MKTSLVALAAALAYSAPALADDSEADAPHHPEIVVTGHHADDRIDLPPATRQTVTAEDIATKVNALSVEDTLKYAPSLIIRKRHIGDNFAPIATRTSGLGASARSLIYADGVLLSAFIGNNHGNGSPRWTLVTPEEIARIDVLYGPFSAAYPGNGIGTTVNITTRQPEKLEASLRVVSNVQTFDLYDTHRTLPTQQYSATFGDKIGPLSLFAAFTRTDAESQPVSVNTVNGTANPKDSAGVLTVGGFADLNRLGSAIRVIGVGGLEHHVQDTYKLKARLDLGSNVHLSYLLGVWTDDTQGTVQSYLQSGTTGAVSYLTANGTSTSGFNSALYWRDAHHTAHAVTLEGSGSHFDWHVVGTSYHYDHDLQSSPAASVALPAAFTGGAGAVQRQDGTGWTTLDAKAAWRPGADNAHVISFGGHLDRYMLNANTYAETSWLDATTQGAVTATSRGRTRTAAIWAQDQLALTPALTLTLGARQEWWRAWGGLNVTTAGSVTQAERKASGFSPKASLEWKASDRLSARLSIGQAWRFPTVGELYQATTIGTQLANPNPSLRPERARSAELALVYADAKGTVRLSLFNEVIDDALISQTNVGTPGITSAYVQNVDRTRARGVELALERQDVLSRLDLSASVTYADAITSKNSGFPGSVGKLLPSVPHWKANLVATYRATDRIALTAAYRMTSRNFATLDNIDTVGQTYQGFWKYSVIDLRVRFQVTDHFEFAAGVDNVNNTKYFLFHPFPQRNFTVQAGWKL